MKKYRIFKTLCMIAMCPAFMILQSCDDYTVQTDNLINAIPDAWDDSEDALTNHAEEILQELAADPEMLAKDTEGEYDSFLDCYTLMKPLDLVGRAVSSAILGDLGDMVNAVSDAEIQNMTKKKATSFINSSYNRNWGLLFAALCATDGEFELVYETDSFADKEFEYKPAEMLKILNEHEALNNGYDIRGGAGSSE